ncbi:MAG: transcriptional repressor NrdR [Calditrichaeota bacterium]|mgnify:FL=1|nr:transcriptional repressor NrdR [Calditrichota bacterium]MBT7788266.1 transcriptional repressor NrdR [Calditrichota bacterium]
MKCPFCGHLEDKVVDSRSKQNGLAIRRRRECLGCNERFTTYEYIERAPLMVKKGDRRTEEFDREKLKSGIMLATVKRNVSSEAIDNIINEVVEKCHELGKQDISTSEIGEMVMNKLRQLDEVAYIRFASVYREFQDLGAFKREIDKM